MNEKTRHPDASTAFSLIDAVRICGEAIASYRIHRADLARSYGELSSIEGGPWRGTCVRGKDVGEMVVTGELAEINDDGRLSGPGVVRDNNPYGQFRDFRLIDPANASPAPGTAVFVVQNKLRYHMDEVRKAAGVLLAMLPQIETFSRSLGVDPTPLTELRHRLPPFPYIPVRAQTTEMPTTAGPVITVNLNSTTFPPDDRDAAVAEDRPFISAALVTLDHVLQSSWLAQHTASKDQDMTGRDTKRGENPRRTKSSAEWLWNAVLTGTTVAGVYRFAFGTAFAIMIVALARVIVGRWDWALFGVVFVAAMTVLWLLLEFARKLKGDHLIRPALTVVWAVVVAFIVLLVVLLVALIRYALTLNAG